MAEVAGGYQADIRAVDSFTLPWEKLQGSRVLVLGATGLIGACVVDMLMLRAQEGFDVYAGGRNRRRAEARFAAYEGNSRFHLLMLDVTERIDSDLCFDYIIDAAGGASPRLYTADPVGVMRSNIMGVDNLLSYGIAHGLRKFVYVSSGEVYGEGDGRAFSEEYSGYVDCTAVRSCYPSAKRAAETLCISYAHQYGVEVCIGRPCHVYGPFFTESDNRVYAQFIRNVLRGENIVLKSRGEQFRSWLYVVDCASALLHLLLKGESGQAYNIANPESNVTILELARTVASLAPGEPKPQVVFDIPDDGTQGNTTPITKAVFCTDRIEGLGWRPLFTLEQGLKHTINALL